MITKKVENVIGKTQDTFDSYYQRHLTNRLTDVLHGDTHPLRTDI